jgi:hypothetical protein
VRAHASEAGPDVGASVAKLVANRAGGREEHLSIGCVALLIHDGESFAIVSFFSFAIGFSSSSMSVARFATSRSGCVRRRYALAGPSVIGSTCFAFTASRKVLSNRSA